MDLFIAAPTVKSLRLRLYARDLTLATATGFVANHGGKSFLLTNHHVVTGQNTITGEFLGKHAVHPEHVEIAHNAAGPIGKHALTSESLYDDAGRGRWLEHPTHGKQVDVVALPLTRTAGVDLYLHDPWKTDPPVALNVTSDVSVVGFPFGRSSSNLALWTRGTVASEINLDHDGLPLYLIDARTRTGQSGSPVVFFARFGLVPLEDGANIVNSGALELFLGVYSGRISEDSDLGMVWKPKAVIDLLATGHRTEVRNGNLTDEPDDIC
ncbi:MAG: trypsin-like peptidase domain-containing protein [Pseudonocardiaceae bacterium]